MAPHPRSTARFLGHPLHPMIVPVPIVCFIAAFITDVVYSVNGVVTWTWASNWLIGAGLGGGALAAAAGLTDFFGSDQIRRIPDAIKHMLANVTAVVVEIVSFVLRLTNPDPGFVSSTGVYLSAAVVLILVYSGWKGGELVYRHGVGVGGDPGEWVSGRHIHR